MSEDYYQPSRLSSLTPMLTNPIAILIAVEVISTFRVSCAVLEASDSNRMVRPLVLLKLPAAPFLGVLVSPHARAY